VLLSRLVLPTQPPAHQRRHRKWRRDPSSHSVHQMPITNVPHFLFHRCLDFSSQYILIESVNLYPFAPDFRATPLLCLDSVTFQVLFSWWVAGGLSEPRAFLSYGFEPPLSFHPLFGIPLGVLFINVLLYYSFKALSFSDVGPSLPLSFFFILSVCA